MCVLCSIGLKFMTEIYTIGRDYATDVWNFIRLRFICRMKQFTDCETPSTADFIIIIQLWLWIWTTSKSIYLLRRIWFLLVGKHWPNTRHDVNWYVYWNRARPIARTQTHTHCRHINDNVYIQIQNQNTNTFNQFGFPRFASVAGI